jgi:hypothetical protein
MQSKVNGRRNLPNDFRHTSKGFIAASVALISLSSCALFGRYILFADGAYMAGMIGQTQNFFINTVEWNRSASYVITQFLPVAVSNNLNPTLNNISLAYGIGCIIPALIFLVSSIKKLENAGIGKFFQLTIPIVFGIGLLICVSTSLLGAAVMFWIFTTFYVKHDLSDVSSLSIFIIFGFSSLFGDSYILFAPSFFLLAVFHFRTSNKFKRISLVSGVVLGVSINLSNFLQRSSGVTAGRASNNAVSLKVIVQNYVFVMSIFALFFLAISALVKKKYLRNTSLSLSFALFIGAIYVGPPSGHMIFQSRYVLAIFLSTCCAVLALPIGRSFFAKLEFRKNDRLIVLSSAMAVIMQIQILIPYSEFLRTVEAEANACKGVKAFETITLSPKAGLYVCDYTNPALSRFLWRNSEGCLIQNRDPSLWQPFTPGDTDPFQRQLYWE